MTYLKKLKQKQLKDLKPVKVSNPEVEVKEKNG